MHLIKIEKKNLKPNNRVDAINILKINKIEFDHDFDEIKRKEERIISHLKKKIKLEIYIYTIIIF